MNTVVTNNLNKLKTWAKRMPNGKVAIVRPKDSLEFSVAISVVQRAVDTGVMTEQAVYDFMTKDLPAVKKTAKKPVKKTTKGKRK
jgi:hypothetical protein